LYGGLDIHKKSITECILYEQGIVVREHKVPVKQNAVERFSEGIPSADISFAMDACGMWQGVYQLFSNLGYMVKLANPKKTHDITCNKKTMLMSMNSSNERVWNWKQADGSLLKVASNY
jgi:transposase